MSNVDQLPATGVEDSHDSVIDIAGGVRELTTKGWPEGYTYGATRYADVVLKECFPDRCRNIVSALLQFKPTLKELRQGGGGRTIFVRRFDDSLAGMKEDGDEIWGKQNITIAKSLSLDGKSIRTSRTRGHEIDMFGKGSLSQAIPGIAVEMEWNNKDPFFDRDLINFQALHREGAIAIGIIVTRGPRLQDVIGPTVRSKDGGNKFGQSTTHWEKLIPKVNLGGGGECPLLLVGIEPERIDGIELAFRVKKRLEKAYEFKSNWKNSHKAWKGDAERAYKTMVENAKELMPPLKEVQSK